MKRICIYKVHYLHLFQLLSETEKKFLFDKELLVVDVGAAPGGWSAYLAALSQVLEPLVL